MKRKSYGWVEREGMGLRRVTVRSKRVRADRRRKRQQRMGR